MSQCSIGIMDRSNSPFTSCSFPVPSSVEDFAVEGHISNVRMVLFIIPVFIEMYLLQQYVTTFNMIQNAKPCTRQSSLPPSISRGAISQHSSSTTTTATTATRTTTALHLHLFMSVCSLPAGGRVRQPSRHQKVPMFPTPEPMQRHP